MGFFLLFLFFWGVGGGLQSLATSSAHTAELSGRIQIWYLISVSFYNLNHSCKLSGKKKKKKKLFSWRHLLIYCHRFVQLISEATESSGLYIKTCLTEILSGLNGMNIPLKKSPTAIIHIWTTRSWHPCEYYIEPVMLSGCTLALPVQFWNSLFFKSKQSVSLYSTKEVTPFWQDPRVWIMETV